MRNSSMFLWRSFSFLFVAMFFISALQAQSIRPDFQKDKLLALEVLKPNLDEGDETLLSSALFLSLRYPLSQNIRIIAELPFAHYGWDSQGSSGSESTLGNPYLGLLWQMPDSPFHFELGVRAPLSPDDDEDNGSAALLGIVADYVDRLEAFISDAVPVALLVNFFHEETMGSGFHLRAGPAFWFKTGEREEVEAFILYSGHVWYSSHKVRLRGGVSGRYWASEEGDFSRRSLHQVNLGLDIELGRLTPGITLRFPLDEDYRDFINFVLGFHLGVEWD